MNLELGEALTLTRRLLGFALFWQGLELFGFASPVWAWSRVRREYATFPRPLLKLLDVICSETGFRCWMLMHMVVALVAMVLPSGMVLYLLALSTWGVSLRFRGAYNGGSDAMTFLQLVGVGTATLTLAKYPAVAEVAVLYVVVQTLLSYFFAGVAKVQNPEWRSGAAVAYYLKDSPYDVPATLASWAQRPWWCGMAAWLVILFELAVLTFFVSPQWFLLWLGLAAGFHVMNFAVLGLGRFVWIWIASYPLLYGLAQSVSW